MITSTLTISNKLGLHARASAKLTKLAGSFKCDVHMSRNGRRVNAKSIMGVMMLAAGMGACVELETDGEDEQAAQDRSPPSSTTSSAKGSELSLQPSGETAPAGPQCAAAAAGRRC